MKNREISQVFERMADILEFKGENPFKVNAYRRASRIIGDLAEDIEKIEDSGRLEDVPGIGKAIARKIQEYLKTGRMTKFEEAKEGVSDELIGLLGIPGLGPKTLSLLNRKLGIQSLSDLKEAIEEGKLRDLPGFGEKKVENIRRGIEIYSSSRGRMALGVALPVVFEMAEDLRGVSGVSRVEPAGSLRRMKETIGDIDILAAGPGGRKIIDAFVRLPQVKEVLAWGDTKASVVVQDGLQVDLRVVEEGSYGSALAYFTGSKSHNIRLREIARTRGLKINEYGIYKDDERIGGEREEDIYKALEMEWIPPELREDRGEVEAAGVRRLPHLVGLSNIRGDLHVHSNWSDGSAGLREIAEQAQSMGYHYVAITDHSQSLKIANGLSPEELCRQVEEIERINGNLSGFRLLSGVEVDIKSDGSLDYPDDLLRRLDIVIAAIHTGFRQSGDRITGRIISALENPEVDIIAHPTGRLLGGRGSYQVDLGKIMEVASETDTALEINAYYDRLDLNDINCRRAKEMGVRLAIGTDSHHLDGMWMMRLGVGVARRGWLEGSDVINAYSSDEVLRWCRGG